MTSDLKATFSLAVPLCVAHLGHQLMGLVDAALLGHYSEAALAGSGIANSLFWAVTVLGTGIVMGLDTLIPQALGAGEPAVARRLFWRGVRLGCVVGVPLMAIAAATPAVLPLLKVDPEVAAQARTYLAYRIPAIVPLLLFAAQRSYLQAIHTTRPLVITMVVGNLANAGVAALLIFGDPGLTSIGLPAIGLPPMGVAGAAIATTSVSLLSAMICALAIRAIDRPAGSEQRRAGDMRAIFRLGLPVGLHLLAEVGVFSLAALMAGRLGKTPSAAHQIAVMLASLSFALALGVGAATSVRVGKAIGARDPAGTRRAGSAGFILAASFMGTCGIVFISIPDVLAGLFTRERHIVDAAVPLLRIAALFQLSDAIQACAAGALRGAGDTRSTFLGNLIGHYAIGLPVSIALGFPLGLGAPGIWWGLSAGLTAVAIGLTTRFFWLANRPIARQ